MFSDRIRRQVRLEELQCLTASSVGRMQLAALSDDKQLWYVITSWRLCGCMTFTSQLPSEEDDVLVAFTNAIILKWEPAIRI